VPVKSAGRSRSRAQKAGGGSDKLRVKQVRSGIGRPALHRRTLASLGLRHHQDVVVVEDTPELRGMLFQVRHLVEVTPVEA
jgi:large subunit ribosomal protein L30